ncbi:MAG: BcepMu30 [Nitrospirae bacterium]|nr:MAG: BcepMu30 [Nitrospirota bacterium]
MIDLKYIFGLPPEKAIEYFKSKGFAISWDWYDIWQEAHAKAFTVAKVTRMDILEDIRNSIQKALKEGTTLQQFKKDLLPTLARKGWGPSGVDMETMKLAEPWRMKTIYEVNMQTALNVGRYKFDIANVDNRPYWMYVALRDSKTRPAHAALNGKVFRYDDPFWNSFYPPNGFRCRCRVRAVSRQDIKEYGLDIESSEGRMDKVEMLVSKKTGELVEVARYTDPFTGYKISPDVGWDYNPGKAAWTPDMKGYDSDIRKL